LYVVGVKCGCKMAQRPELPDEIERHAARLGREPGSRVFAQLADAYRKEGLLEEAIRICRDGLIVHPGYTTARVVLGRALLELGALEEAEAEFGRVLEQVPDNLLGLRLLGDIFVRRERPAEARAYYERALRVNPRDPETQERLAALPTEAVPGGTSPGEPSAREDFLAGTPRIDMRRGGGAAVDPLASPTLAALYASQGFTDVAKAMSAQLGDALGERLIPPAGWERPRPGAPQSALLAMLVSLREAARQAREARHTGQGVRGRDDY
jgi:tetratricopeptide (TPR) repeat protein